MNTLALLACASLTLLSAHGQDKIPVLIIDGINNHDWERGTRILRETLEKSGRFTVDISTTPNAEAPPAAWEKWRPDFSKYQAIINNFNSGHSPQSLRWPAPVEAALEKYLRAGGGLIIFHAANNAFRAWPAYNDMIGLGWRDKNFGPSLLVGPDEKILTIPAGQGRDPGHGPEHDFAITVLHPEHPIVRGFPKKWRHLHEQLTHGQHGPGADLASLTILDYAWSKDTQENEPLDWVLPYGAGRVYVTMLGHLWKDGPETAIRCPGFQTLFLRGTEWAATSHVTLPLPPDFPAEVQ